MLTPQDVRSVQFEKNLRGYRTEDVDRFLDKVEEQLQQNDAQAEQLRRIRSSRVSCKALRLTAICSRAH